MELKYLDLLVGSSAGRHAYGANTYTCGILPSRSKLVKRRCLKEGMAIALFNLSQKGLRGDWKPAKCIYRSPTSSQDLLRSLFLQPSATQVLLQFLRSTTATSSIPDSRTPSVESSNTEHGRSHSMPLPTRDISLLKDTLRVVWDHFLPFAASGQAIPFMTAFFSEIQNQLVKTSSLQIAKQALSFTYGGLKLTFYSAGPIAWAVIGDFLQFMIEKLKAGLAGFFETKIIGPYGAVAIVTLTAIIFSKVNHGPAVIGGQKPNPYLPWDPVWLG